MISTSLRQRGRWHVLLAVFTLIATLLGATALAAVSPASAQEGLIPVVDTDGPDAGTKQTDLTAALIGANGAFGWAWDEVNLSGQNTLDTCTYYEKSDGTVLSVCYSVITDADGVPAADYPKVTVYECGTTYNADQGKCQSGDVSTDYTVTCTNPSTVPGYFSSDTGNDLQVSCQLQGPDLEGLRLLDICSKASASPSSASPDCIYGEYPAFLQLAKVVTDGSDANAWILTATGPSTISGSGGTISTPVSSGTYNLTEAGDTEKYRLESISCVTDGGEAVDVTASAEITIASASNTVCTFTNVPNAVAPQTSVVKGSAAGNDTVAEIDEPGGEVTIPVVITNNAPAGIGDATLTALSDSPYGDITTVQGSVTATTCSVNVVIVGGESYSCEFTVQVTGEPGTYNDTVSATLTNTAGEDTKTDEANVVITDVPPTVEVTKTANPTEVPETGGEVTFTFTVKNTSSEATTVTAISDSVFGDLNGQGSCATGAELAPDETYTCALTVNLSGEPSETHTNTVTGTITDNDGTPATGTATAEVTFTDVLPEISVTKEASVGSVSEPGGDVTFTVVVTNDSAEDVTITSLTDSDFDLSAYCPDAVGTVLAPGETFPCEFTVFVSGNPADGNHENTVTATAEDNDGNSDDAEDTATVVIDNVEPSITVTKTASQKEVFAPGEAVEFTIEITNNSVSSDPVTITSLNDSVFGDLTDACGLPVTIEPDGSWPCSFTRDITGDHTNTVTASGADDEGSPVSGEAEASVGYVEPSVSIEKTTNGSDGPELLVDTDVTWTYVVTNDGDADLTGVSVTDDQGVTVSCPSDSLAAGESMTCTATGTATEGDYANIGTVTGTATDADGDTAPVTDTDGSSYFGAAPALDIDKQTTTATGTGDSEYAVEGDAVTWTYTVTNTGNVDLSGIAVTDDIEGTISCPTDSLAVGESTTCTATGTAVLGAYSNTGTASSNYTDGAGNSREVNATDGSGYTGVTQNQPSITQTAPALTADGNTGFTGKTTLTNASSDADTIVVTSFDVTVEKIVKGKPAGEVDVTCTVNGQPTGDLDDPIAFTDSTELTFSCVTADGAPLAGQYEVTIETRILNRDKVFVERNRIKY